MIVGIIGYGSMGRMLLWRFSEYAGLDKQSILVSNRTSDKLKEAEDVAIITDNHGVAGNADIIFICVRPVDLKGVLEEIRNDIRPDALLVSLNGSISFQSIHKVISGKTAKVIPSVTAEIGRSQTLVCFDDNAEEKDKAHLIALLKHIGDVIELPEDEMGMGSELVSCMPGFIASIFDVICSSAKKHTLLPKEQIARMVLATMSATGDLMIRRDMSFDDVVKRVATKGGITEEGTRVIYDGLPKTADLLFEKTLEKRRLTSETTQKTFEE